MKITVHRGQNQIGGNIIEVSTPRTRILLDIGKELGGKTEDSPEIRGLIQDETINAVFISHNHGDHMGLVKIMDRRIHLYMSRNSYDIIKAADKYKGETSFDPPNFFTDKMSVKVGDLTIIPIQCDHSAYDSHMFLIKGEGKTILYTGDFRANGRKSFQQLLDQLPTAIDGIILEGTALSRNNGVHESEEELEKKAISIFSNTQGPVFVLMSGQNIDRMTTMSNAARASNRIFLQDVYIAGITYGLGENAPNPAIQRHVRVFTDKQLKKNDPKYLSMQQYGWKKISRARIIKKPFVMCVRTSMLDYLQSINNLMSLRGGLLIYSMWQGYKSMGSVKEFLNGCKDLGLKEIPLHTSGHADGDTIRKLIDHTNPKFVVPVHTDAPDWFSDYTKKGIAVLLDSPVIEV